MLVAVNTWMIVAISLAAVSMVLLCIGFVVFRRRQRRRDEDTPPIQRHLIFSDSKYAVADDTVNTRLDTSSTGPYTDGYSGEPGAGYSVSFLTAAQGGMWEDDIITAMRIPMEKLTRGKLVNKGGYGMVYRGSYRGESVAIKTLLPEQRKTLRQINDFLAEIKMMAALEHPRIVRLLGVAWDSLADLCSIAKYMEGGDLRTLLNYFEYHEHRPHGFDLDKSRIALHVAHSLTYLHSLNPLVLHRDLKSKNILLTENLDAKITDFGVSRESTDRTMTAGVGTSLWMAPEVMMGERYGSSVDIFSFGVVLSELDSHVLPYAAAKETDSGLLTTSTFTPTTQTTTTNAVSEAESTSSPASSSSYSTEVTSAPASASASANASTTVIINVDSHSSDSEASSGVTVVESSDKGVSTGTVIGIAAGAVVFVLLIAGFAFWLYRRRKQKMTPRSPSFDASYAIAPVTLPAADPIVLESYEPSPAIAVHDLNNFDRTVDLDSRGGLDSTLRLESSTASIPTTKKTNKPSLWGDEAILAARIPMEKLIRKELVNEGGHGAVYYGLYRGKCVAIKVLLPDKRKDMRQINIFLSEIKMMASVEHPRIVRFIGVAWDALSDLCAVSEFMPGGDLFSLLRRFDRVDNRPQGFDGDKAKIALHVAQALTYLHSLDPIVLHRDLKSMNILLSEDWDAKLTDFGVSRKWTVETMTQGVGTRRWMAPEVMMGKHYDTSADIFSFGVVLSELDSHQPPYASTIATITSDSGEKVTETALMEMVAMGRVRVEFPPNAPVALVNLGHACVDLDPRARPSAGEVHYQLQKILRRYQKYTL